jgi:hypothetical protein
MTRSSQRRESKRSREAAAKRWLALASNDPVGVDSDIEALLERLQQVEGVSREMANAELVRRLSFAA